jgi:hypothetical protein
MKQAERSLAVEVQNAQVVACDHLLQIVGRSSMIHVNCRLCIGNIFHGHATAAADGRRFGVAASQIGRTPRQRL